MLTRVTRVTSHDVAAEAGVSQATVTRAFSAPNRVAPPTAARVRAAAERLGYVPNAIAGSLKSQRTHIVGAVVSAHGEYWQHAVAALGRRLSDRDHQLLVFSFTDARQVEEALEAVERYRIDGLVLASATIGRDQLVRMSQPGARIVAFNQPAAAGVLPLVTVDNEGGARDLANHVIDQGAASAVFVGGVEEASTDQKRYRGASTALAEAGIACRYIEAGAFSYDAGYQVVATLLDDPLPDVVMVGSDEVAFGVLDGLRWAGVDVPGEVMVTGFDGLPQASWAGYDLTTVAQPIDVLVAELVDSVVGPDDDEPHLRIVPGALRLGRTTRTDHG